jgi:DNA adenine methylase
MATPRLVPPLKWAGGKRYVAPAVLELMPPHLHYCEPFFGGGQVLFRRDPRDPRFWWDGKTSDGRTPDGVSELVNDLDGNLMNFYRVLKDPELFSRLREWLDKTLFNEAEWEESNHVLAGSQGDPVVRAGSLFVQVRQSYSGERGSHSPTTRTRLREGRNGDVNAWWNAVEGLAAVHRRLRDVRVFCQPALDVIKREDAEETFFYCDPPYPHETRTSTDLYTHEMSLADHRELLAALRQCKGWVILSSYANDLYDTVLSDWTRRSLDVPNSMASGKKKERKIEVLWYNFE